MINWISEPFSKHWIGKGLIANLARKQHVIANDEERRATDYAQQIHASNYLHSFIVDHNGITNSKSAKASAWSAVAATVATACSNTNNIKSSYAKNVALFFTRKASLLYSTLHANIRTRSWHQEEDAANVDNCSKLSHSAVAVVACNHLQYSLHINHQATAEKSLI